LYEVFFAPVHILGIRLEIGAKTHAGPDNHESVIAVGFYSKQEPVNKI
jgi:hypothetical protein